MARMLGHLGTGECGCRDCSPPPGRHSSRTNRGLKRREQHELSDELAAELREALERSERGESIDLGDFSQYADD